MRSLSLLSGLKRRAGHAAVWLICGALIALTSAAALATVAVYMDLPSLVERADVIVHGHVKDQAVAYDEARGLSLLRTTLVVKHAYLGTPDKTLIIQQLGGEHQGATLRIAGDASFKPGEEVIVFLNKGEGQTHYLNALGQSKFSLVRQGKTMMVVRDLSGLAFARPGVQGVAEFKEEPAKLRSFTRELEQTIAQVKGVKP